MRKDYYALDLEKTFADLDSKKIGISESEAKTRLKEFGENKIPEERKLGGIFLFLSGFTSPLIYILVIAGIITLLLSDWTDSIIIFLAVFVNVVVGYVQEKKAAGTLSELREALKLKITVLRNNKKIKIPQEQIVSGDILLLAPGEKVGADARLFEEKDLRVNESILTGEWRESKKETRRHKYDTPLGDQNNMVFMGTTVESGIGKAVVTATGSSTEFGKIAGLIKKTKEEKTPYQKRLAKFARLVAIITIIVSLVIFIEGIITGENFVEMFTVSVAVAVAAIPEGLPIAMTVILALSMVRILKKKGLVRRLNSAETLGSTSVICVDKTGTITEGKMKLKGVVSGKEEKKKTLCIAALRSEVYLDEKKVIGRPTDKALYLAAKEEGILKDKLLKKYPKLSEIPFESKNKFSASLHKFSRSEIVLYVMGAPEFILKKSEKVEISGKIFEIGEERRKKLDVKHEKLVRKGLRVLAVAYRKFNSHKLDLNSEQISELTFVGFISLEDPIRSKVKKSILKSKNAGIRPVMITGDHKLTAKRVAEEIGLSVERENIVTGAELQKISGSKLVSKAGELTVFARVSPEQKLKIVTALQKRGEVVAMTGDGVNDAPALKKADIGVAVGSGTNVVKETSDLVLLENNFSVIVSAIEEGRAIIDNIRKVITYLLADSFTEIVLVGGALLFGLPLPITAAQILWVNLIEDGLPGMALAFEKKEKGLMERKPEKRNKPLLTSEMKVIIFAVGFLTTLALFLIFIWLFRQEADILYIRTMVFAALTIDSLFYVFSCKNLHKNIWQINIFSNKFLLITWIIGVLMLVSALYLPFLQIILKTTPLSFSDWLILFGLGFLNLTLIEGAKWIFIRSKKPQEPRRVRGRQEARSKN